MPCYGPETNSCKELRDELDEATGHLCWVLNYLKKKKLIKDVPLAIREWSAQHDELDKEREDEQKRAREQYETRQKALKKLTRAEREALGLDG